MAIEIYLAKEADNKFDTIIETFLFEWDQLITR